jgi:glycosyltransferase involved in cell wall biosynthesis
MEGCSKDVFALKDHFPSSRVFGLSRFYLLRISWRERYFGLNVRLYRLFRVLALLWEARSDVNHIYGSLSEWFFLRALRRRPTVLTVATCAAPLQPEEYRHITRFVTHSRKTTESMIARGFDRAVIREIYPGIDLDRFASEPRLAAWPFAPDSGGDGRFRVLFASTPNWPDGLKVKGVDLMIDTARALPDVEFCMLWRPWPGAAELVESIKRRATLNVRIPLAAISDMRPVYQAADATIAPFLTEDNTKICPTSLVESLACGRPLLVSSEVGIARLVRDEGCGVVFDPTPEALAAAVQTLRDNYRQYSARARPTAEKHFSLADCQRRHEQLYEEMVTAC